MTTVYLSGPVSLDGTAGPEAIAAYIAVFTREAARLRDAGYEVINPCECEEQPSWQAYMKIHIPNVCRADTIGTLPEWERSRGSKLEVYIGGELDIPVVPAETLQ